MLRRGERWVPQEWKDRLDGEDEFGSGRRGWELLVLVVVLLFGRVTEEGVGVGTMKVESRRRSLVAADDGSKTTRGKKATSLGNSTGA